MDKMLEEEVAVALKKIWDDPLSVYSPAQAIRFCRQYAAMILWAARHKTGEERARFLAAADAWKNRI